MRLASLWTGDFLSRERVRLWSAAFLLAFAAAVLFLAATAHGLNDYKGRPLGTDFSDVYTAGSMAVNGAALQVYDIARHYRAEQALFGAGTPCYGWHYPPFFLLIAAALSLMPYVAALIAWQSASFGLYLLAMARLLRGTPLARDRTWVLCAAAFPAVFVNLTHGQNGFLTAALFAGALALLDERPLIAGILFGLTAYKPQFGILIPPLLAATGRWKSFGAASATVAVLVLTATLAFGPGIWSAFLTSAGFSRSVVLEQGSSGFHKIQSVFAAVRLWGGSVGAAYAAQAVMTAGALILSLWLWRSPASSAAKGAGLCIAVILATPYSLDYDLMLLAPAVALLAAEGMERGFVPGEGLALAALWIVPIATRTAAGMLHLPLGLAAIVLCFALVMRRVRPARLLPVTA